MYEHYYKGKLVASSQDREEGKFSVWDVFEEYADVRDELEDLLDGLRSLQENIELAVYDLEGDLEEVEGHLDKCDRVFRRFRAKRRYEEEAFEARCRDTDNDDAKEDMPFDEHPGSGTEPSSLV